MTRRCAGTGCRAESNGYCLKRQWCGGEDCKQDIFRQQLAKADKAAEKKRAEKNKEDRRKHRADKIRIKTKNEWVKEAQSAVNKYIRLRDYHKPCVSCLRSREEVEHYYYGKLGGAWDAGHYRTRASAKQLRFNLLNIHKQCKKCNGGKAQFTSKSDSVKKGYDKEIVLRIGQSNVDSILNNNDLECDTIEKLARIKAIFTKRAKLYEKRISN